MAPISHPTLQLIIRFNSVIWSSIMIYDYDTILLDYNRLSDSYLYFRFLSLVFSCIRDQCISVSNVGGKGGSTKSWRNERKRSTIQRVSVAMRRSAGGRGCILLHRDSRVSFQRDAMWHFNALFQPAKCLICKTRSRSSRSFAVRVSLPPSSFSSLFLNAVISVSLSLSLSSLLPSVFSILFVRSVAADPAFVSPCCCCSYCTTVVPVTFGSRPLCGTRRCTKHFSLFHSWTTR